MRKISVHCSLCRKPIEESHPRTPTDAGFVHTQHCSENVLALAFGGLFGGTEPEVLKRIQELEIALSELALNEQKEGTR